MLLRDNGENPGTSEVMNSLDSPQRSSLRSRPAKLCGTQFEFTFIPLTITSLELKLPSWENGTGGYVDRGRNVQIIWNMKRSDFFPFWNQLRAGSGDQRDSAGYRARKCDNLCTRSTQYGNAQDRDT